jgi:hypothetical protein
MSTSSLLRFEAMCRPWTGCADVGVVLCGGRYAEGAGRAGTSKVVAFGDLGATNEPLASAGGRAQRRYRVHRPTRIFQVGDAAVALGWWLLLGDNRCCQHRQDPPPCWPECPGGGRHRGCHCPPDCGACSERYRCRRYQLIIIRFTVAASGGVGMPIMGIYLTTYTKAVVHTYICRVCGCMWRLRDIL